MKDFSNLLPIKFVPAKSKCEGHIWHKLQICKILSFSLRNKMCAGMEIILKKIKVIRLSILLIVIIVFLSFLGQAMSGKEKPVSLTISAASSLKDAMEEIKLNFIKENPNVNVIFNYGASGSLQKQIEQGAEVDLFISAAAKQMDALEESGMIIEDTRKNLLGNRIVLVIPKDSVTVSDFKVLTDDKVKKIALGEPKSVPAGQYGEEVLKNLNLLDAVKPKVVYGKDVKEVLTWVETGNADAGIVYETDAKASDKVKIAAEALEDSHSPIVYTAAVMKDTKKIDEAKAFINYLYSPKAKLVFEKYGFIFLIDE